MTSLNSGWRHDEYGDPRRIDTEYYDVTKNL